MIDETRIVRNIKKVIREIKKSRDWEIECMRTSDVVLMLEAILGTIAEAKVDQPTIQPQTGWIPCSDAVDISYLHDWYIASVMDDEPVWTEKHLEELFNDFILIPKPLPRPYKESE